MILNDMTPEQMEKAQACKTSEELAGFAQSIGITLSEEELRAFEEEERDGDSDETL